MKNVGSGPIDERERLRLEWEALWDEPMPVMKPPVAVVMVPVSNGFAEKASANPDEVRVSVREPNGVTTVERPRANPNHVRVMVDHVREVDAQGRPIWPTVGAVHAYDPLDALKR
jgi:hypothetical protein